MVNNFAVFFARLHVVTLVLGLGTVWAEVAPGRSIRSLVDQSDLILTGRIERVDQIGEASVKLKSSAYRRRDFQATISVDETIKGDAPPSRFILNYSKPTVNSSGNMVEGGLFPNTYQVVFLKKIPTGFAFVSPYYPSLPASPTSCGEGLQLKSGEKAYQKVLHRELSLLCASSTPEEKQWALSTLNWDEDSSAAPSLKAALNLPEVGTDPLLRSMIVSFLLKWKDLSVLPYAEEDIFQSSSVDASLKSNLLLAISSLDPHLSVPLLTRALMLPEAEARVGAARFLEYTNSDSALDGLLSALDDPDADVQFAVMQSLGNLTNQHQWRPKTTTTDASWFACIRHWQEFGALRQTSNTKSTL